MPWEREYFKLAAMWLACRMETMSGRNYYRPSQPCDLAFALLGEHDYWQEMRLMILERG